MSFDIGKKTRKFFIDWHRDIGYFFTGVILIYAISGIALNHLKDWNPSYSVEQKEFVVNVPQDYKQITESDVLSIVKKSGLSEYKKFYFPSSNKMKVFVKDGTISVNLKTGTATLERLKKRFLLAEMNYLHYNPVRIWTYFSDIFAVALIFLAVSGLMILKGKYGFRKRGWWLVLAGLVFPILILIIYY
jgi:hypothetical protein